MTVPSAFTPSRERVLTNYNFIDIAKNRAVTNLYGHHSMNLTTNIYTLTSAKPYSTYFSTRSTTTTTTPNTLLKTIDFDMTFDAPIRTQGDFVVNVPFATQVATGNNTAKSNVSAEIFHIDKNGTATSIIGTHVSSQTISIVDPTTLKTNAALKLADSNLRTWKKDETMRLRIKQNGWSEGGSTVLTTCHLGHSPNNGDTNNGAEELDWTSTVSILQVQVPIVIDL